MARRNLTELRVFVASPSDLDTERASLEDVVQELNRLWSDNTGIRLELVMWEKHTRPAIGADTQDVINTQIGDDYDIFLGLLWTRLGTPTARAESGTAEELERALARYEKDPKSVRIMFYFKDAPVVLSDIDPEQLARLRAFRDRLSQIGVLFREFRRTEELLAYLRTDLSKEVQCWGKTWGETGQAELRERQMGPPEEPVPVEEEEGYLDLMESALEGLDATNLSLGRMTSSLSDLAERARSRTEEMQRIGRVDSQGALKQAKRTGNLAARDLKTFAAALRSETVEYGRNLDSSMRALTRVLAMAEVSTEDVQELRDFGDQIDILNAEIVDARGAILDLRETVRKSPRLTTEYNRARREVVAELDVLSREYDGNIASLTAVGEQIRRLVDEAGSS